MSTPKWKRVSAERYDEMLNILPPLDFDGRRFLVGEAVSDRDGAATYTAFAKISDEHFECSEPLTRAEFRQVVGTEFVASAVRDIRVLYRACDGASSEKRFDNLAAASAHARHWVGDYPTLGSSYAVSDDGIGTIRVEGASLAELFPAAC